MTVKTYEVIFRSRGGARVEVHVDALTAREAVDGGALRPDCARVIKAAPFNG